MKTGGIRSSGKARGVPWPSSEHGRKDIGVDRAQSFGNFSPSFPNEGGQKSQLLRILNPQALQSIHSAGPLRHWHVDLVPHE